MKSIKDTYYLLINQSKISKYIIEKGFVIVKFPSGKIYKIKEIG